MNTIHESITVDQIQSLSVIELRKLIRQYDLHKKNKIAGTDLARMNLDECRSFLLAGIVPQRFKAHAASAVQANTDALAQLQALLCNTEQIKQDVTESVIELIESYRDEIKTELLNIAPRKIEITINNDKPVITDKPKHFKFELVLKCIAARVNVALVGAAGSGKSTLAKDICEVLGLEFKPHSFNIMSSKSEVLGLVDANGKYHASGFRSVYENGGLFLADEMDSCHAATATILNSAIANRFCTFADGQTIQAHDNFYFIAGMNTFGTGSTSEYTGRSRLDAATLDRFCYITIDYDEQLEKNLLGLGYEANNFNIQDGGLIDVHQWLGIVKKYRDKVKARNIKHIISPRASLMGKDLIAQGIGRDVLIDMLIRKGLDQQTWSELN